ncbi:sulfatase-like hydrolase/transferase, partial [Paenibacillus chitinolyticus]|uniref:sulfatase-like hydrolase/transferase n=1 Tax=Paenibacillus chitinolyticus TaxID=79263 RepID=UPI00295EAAE2
MRNIIMISTDQQKANAMGCVDPSYYTPNLDKLVDRSIRFTGAISTSAQCSPSRASWMTGKFPHQVGVYQIGHMLDPQEWGIAKEFNRAGYETVYFGKWHLGLSPAHHEFQVTDYRTDGLELAGAQTDPRFHSNKDAVTTAQALNYLEDYDGSKAFFMKM